MAKHKIALIPGDGIGKEVLPEGVRVLEAAARRSRALASCSAFSANSTRLPESARMKAVSSALVVG